MSTKSTIHKRTFNSHYINYTMHSKNLTQTKASHSPLGKNKLWFLLQFISGCSCTILLSFSHSFPGTPIYCSLFLLTIPQLYTFLPSQSHIHATCLMSPLLQP